MVYHSHLLLKLNSSLFQNRYPPHINKKGEEEALPTDDVKPTVKVEKEDWQPVSYLLYVIL